MTATATIKSEMPTYFAVCTRSGNWSERPNSQSAEAPAIREYLSHGDAFNFLSMVLRSAAPPGCCGMNYALLHCILVCCAAKKQAREFTWTGGSPTYWRMRATPNLHADLQL